MSSQDTSRLVFVDSLRLIAALLVFAQHAVERHREIPVLDALTRIGPGLAGVVIFFLVSGYVVPMSVRKGLDPAPFMIRRIFRIYPLLLAALGLLLAAGASGVLARWSFMAEASPFQWAANLLLIQDYVGARPFLGVTWTLAIEFAWYALFALSLWLFGDRAGRVLIAVMPLGPLMLAGLSLLLEARIPLGRAAMLYVCVLGYQAFLHDTGRLSRRALALSIGLFLGVTAFTNYVAFGIFRHEHLTLVQAMWPWTLAPLVFFGIVLTPALRRSRVLNAGVVPAWGAASFSIYLLHPIGLEAAGQYVSDAPAQIALAVAITGGLSFFGYRYVELPGIALGRRVAGWFGRGPRGVALEPAR